MCINKVAHLKTRDVLPNKENKICWPGNDFYMTLSVRVYDAFVEDESVAFGTCDDFEMLGAWVSPEEIGVDDVYVASIVEGVS